MANRNLAAGLVGLLSFLVVSTQSIAQQPPLLPVPTAAQAAAADQRQGQTVNVNGANIFYQVSGSGTPLILIHGFPLSGQLFQGQLAGLSQRFEVITPDLRGFGKSVAPNDRGSIELYARDILAFMNQLGIRKAIIGGHSMGGQITLQLYRDAPARFLGMILIDTNATAATIVEQAEWPAFGVQAQTLGVPSIVPTIAPQMLTGTERLNNQPATLTMMDIIAEASLNGVIGGGQALANRPDDTALLPSIAVPTLVLVGVDDPIYSWEISAMTSAVIPNSTFVIIPQAEHASIFEQPGYSNTVIRQWAAQKSLQ